jgi:hypothetical protein
MMIEDTNTELPKTAVNLFSVGQITLATFLGMPKAGCLLLARNYREIGNGRAAWQSFAAGIASTTLLLFIAFRLPENFPNGALPFAYCFGMRQIASYLQRGGVVNSRKGSWTVTVASGVGCLIVIFGLSVCLIMVLNAE